MLNKFKEIAQLFLPFILIGIIICFLIALVILFSYLLFWGIIVGAILWLISSIRRYFAINKPTTPPVEGRIIEHDDQ